MERGWKRQGGAVATLALGAAVTTAAHADVVTLANGDQINGRVVDQSETQVVIEHADLGRLEIDGGDVQSVVVASDAGDASDRTEEAPALAAVQDDPAMDPPPEWKSQFVLGGSASTGNTDTQSVRLAVTSKRESDWDRTNLDFVYDYGATDGDRTSNRATLGAQHDWLMPDSKWFYFVTGRYDYEEFQSWEHRLSGGGGVGYELFDEEDFTMNLRAGVGVVREYNSPNTDTRPELLLGFDLVWQISERQKLEAGSTFYPDLDDTGEFRLISYAGWSLEVDPETNTSLVARVENEYQSIVAAGRKHSDVRAVIGLRFDF